MQGIAAVQAELRSVRWTDGAATPCRTCLDRQMIVKLVHVQHFLVQEQCSRKHSHIWSLFACGSDDHSTLPLVCTLQCLAIDKAG